MAHIATKIAGTPPPPLLSTLPPSLSVCLSLSLSLSVCLSVCLSLLSVSLSLFFRNSRGSGGHYFFLRKMHVEILPSSAMLTASLKQLLLSMFWQLHLSAFRQRLVWTFQLPLLLTSLQLDLLSTLLAF